MVMIYVCGVISQRHFLQKTRFLNTVIYLTLNYPKSKSHRRAAS